jgi:hypothetical protein
MCGYTANIGFKMKDASGILIIPPAGMTINPVRKPVLP